MPLPAAASGASFSCLLSNEKARTILEQPQARRKSGRTSARCHCVSNAVTYSETLSLIIEFTLCRFALSCDSSRTAKRSHVQSVAEEVGFEPTVGLHLHRFSRPALSTTQAPLLFADGSSKRPRRAGAFGRASSHFTKCPAFLEEFFEHFATLSRHHARGDLAPVVEAGVRNHLIKTGAASGFGVSRAVDQTLDA